MDSPYLTIAEGAQHAGVTPRVIYDHMRSGRLVEGVHFVRRRGSRPMLKRVEFYAWAEGRDEMFTAREVRVRRDKRVNWDLVEGQG